MSLPRKPRSPPLTSSTSTSSQAPVAGSQSETTVALPAREATRTEPSVSTVQWVAPSSSVTDSRSGSPAPVGGQGARPGQHVRAVVGELGVDGPGHVGVVALAHPRLGLRDGTVVEHDAVADVGDRASRARRTGRAKLPSRSHTEVPLPSRKKTAPSSKASMTSVAGVADDVDGVDHRDRLRVDDVDPRHAVALDRHGHAGRRGVRLGRRVEVRAPVDRTRQRASGSPRRGRAAPGTRRRRRRRPRGSRRRRCRSRGTCEVGTRSPP